MLTPNYLSSYDVYVHSATGTPDTTGGDYSLTDYSPTGDTNPKLSRGRRGAVAAPAGPCWGP